MELYIKVLNGKPEGHPLLKENISTAYPEVDFNNLPVWLAKFVRVPQPKLGPYEKAEVRYEWVGDVISDVWYIHQMSESEKANKIAIVKKTWIEDNCPVDWIFDEARCCHVPPVPFPQDGKEYIWVQQAGNWVEKKPSASPMSSRPPYPVTDPNDTRSFLWNEAKNDWEEVSPISLKNPNSP